MRGFLRGCLEVPAVGILLVGLALVALSRKLMRGWVVVALSALTACKTSSHAEIQTSATEQVETHAASQSDTVTTVTTGPERTTTTVEEFDEAQENASPNPASAHEALSEELDRGTADPALVRGPRLVRRTVTVEERGPVLTESHSEGHTATETHVQAETRIQASSDHQSAPATGCGLGMGLVWLGPLVLVAALWQFRRFLPWWPK